MKAENKAIPYDWVKRNTYIAHGLGGKGTYNVTNSLEAFEENYEKGYRVFEIDLALTSDHKLVARHDWDEYLFVYLGQKVPKKSPLSLKEFKKMKIHKDLTPLTFKDALRLMKEYPDIYFVLDTKGNATKIISQVIDVTKKKEPDLLERLIPQFESEYMYAMISKKYDFPNKIFTTYHSGMTRQQILSFLKENDFKVVTLSEGIATKEYISALNKMGVSVYVHTINKEKDMEKYLDLGVHGVYSDYLNP
jgi:glycerophosphoryl diester phosphodiesterase